MTLEDDQDEEICNCAVCSKRSEQLLLRSTTFLTLFLILLLHLLMFIVLLFLYGYGVYLNSTSTALPNTLIAFAPLLAISQLARGTGNRLGATGTGTSSRRPRSIPKHSEEGCSNLRMRPQCSREYSASESPSASVPRSLCKRPILPPFMNKSLVRQICVPISWAW